MINKKYLKLLRSKDRKYGKNFIYNEISKNIIDSLDILKVPSFSSPWARHLLRPLW